MLNQEETILETTELHKSLQSKLEKWAVSKGYSEELPPYNNMWPKNLKPDVLKLTPNQEGLFVGDAKNSANETAKKGSTVARIINYIGQFSLLGAKEIAGGTIAIATDDEDSAKAWVTTLNGLASGLTDKAGKPPNFEVSCYDDDTWIVHWWAHKALGMSLDIENQSGIQ